MGEARYLPAAVKENWRVRGTAHRLSFRYRWYAAAVQRARECQFPIAVL